MAGRRSKYTPETVDKITQAIRLGATYKLACGVVGVLLRVRPISLLKLVQHHRELVERRVCYGLGWCAALAWLTRSLEYLGFLKPLLASGLALLSVRLERGSIAKHLCRHPLRALDPRVCTARTGAARRTRPPGPQWR